MKKSGVLNSQISKVISEMGHTDTIVICDSGLPIPDHVTRIDLALKQGVPTFMDTLATVLSELQVEKAYAAEELAAAGHPIKAEMESLLGTAPLVPISHEKLKEMSKQAKAVIRTGEFTPYANVILQAGVIF